MMISNANQAVTFPFDEFSPEVKLKALLRFEWHELINYSFTNRANHAFVWETPELLDKIITSKIVRLATTYFENPIYEYDTSTLKWYYTIALSKIDLDQAFQFAMKNFDTCLKCTSSREFSKQQDDPEKSIKILMQAAKICKEDKLFGRAFEFLRYFAGDLVPLDSEKALEVYEMIDDKKERLVTAVNIAKHLPYGRKEEFLKEIVQDLMSSSILTYRHHQILENIVDEIPLHTMQMLLEKALQDYWNETDSDKYHYIIRHGIKSYHNHALRLLPEDHNWIFWFIEQLKEPKYLIEAYSLLASLFIDIDPEPANISIEKAKGLLDQVPNNGRCYAYIADALAKSDPVSAQDFFVKGCDLLRQENGVSNKLDFNIVILQLSKLNLELALTYNDRIKSDTNKACNLYSISQYAMKSELMDRAIDLLLMEKKGAHHFVQLGIKGVLKFGEDFAVKQLNKVQDQYAKAQLLMKLSKLMLTINLERAFHYAQEGIALSNQLTHTFQKIFSLLEYAHPNIC
jgi:hypothetical protein